MRGPLLAKLRHYSGCGRVQERAIFLSAEREAVRGAAGNHAAYLRAVRGFYRLLQIFPYGRFRREADWDLAQIELRELNLPRPARAHLRDFLARYPADSRASLARLELRGEVPRAPFLLNIGDLHLRAAPLLGAVPASDAATDYRQSLSSRQAARQALDRERLAYSTASTVPASLPAPPAPGAATATFQNLHIWSGQGLTRIILHLTNRVSISSGYVKENRHLYFDLSPCVTAWTYGEHHYNVNDERLRGIQAADNRNGVVRVVLDESADAGAASVRYFPNPSRFVITIRDRGVLPQPQIAALARPNAPAQPASVRPPATTPAPPRTFPQRLVREALTQSTPAGAVTRRVAKPLPGGRRSLTRALDLSVRRVVIDAGHGGHDTGTIGPDGLYEKNIVLSIALRLGRLLRRNLGVQVIYTRDRDVFIPLQERTAIANRAHADLFVSIHANASRDRSASGIETYYLNFTRDPRALAVAARENAGSGYDIHNLDGLIQKIAADDKQMESRDLARDLENSLTRRLDQRYRGVKSAPFIVLIGARMPSVLAEVSFLSNPVYARRLSHPAYRERIAYALYRGIRHYLDSLGQAPRAAAPVLARSRHPGERVAARTHRAEH